MADEELVYLILSYYDRNHAHCLNLFIQPHAEGVPVQSLPSEGEFAQIQQTNKAV